MSRTSWSQVFSFPNPVNEKSARAVAGQVVLATVVVEVLGLTVSSAWLWLSAALALGFLARVLSGPTLSPFGQIATRLIAPHLGPAKIVPGPPKRFAQGMGLAMTLAATVAVALGAPVVAQVLLAGLIVAATLESVFALCLGCKMFALGMRLGIIPESACPECANVPLHFERLAAARQHAEHAAV